MNNVTTKINQLADFWRYDIGVNVIPADTRKRSIYIEWKQYQDKLISEEQHNRWKKECAFSNGLAIIPGKVWYRADKQDLYLVFIDSDKKEGIKEICTRNGETITLEKVAQKFIVEQHKDNLEKAHIYFYSPIPFPKKNPDSIIGLEIKSLGEHGIAFCTPSTHKDGYPYEIIGTDKPTTLTVEHARELIQHIDQICIKNGLQYLEKDYGSSNLNAKLRNIIKTLKIDNTVKIPKGQRHVTLISVANSLLFTHLDNKGKKKTEKELRRFFEQINILCEPEPLPDSEINSIWNSALNFVSRTRKNEEEEKAQEIMKNNRNLNSIITNHLLNY